MAIDEAVRLAHWFGGARAPGFVNGVLDGIAARRSGRPVNVLVVNWQDRENPQAGGAEIHLFEIFGRLAARGHRVRLVCSGWPGAPPTATIDGIEVERTGTPEQLRALGAARGAPGARGGAARHRGRGHQQAAALSRWDDRAAVLRASCRICSATTAFEEAPWPMAATVWAAERPLPRAYRRAGFHAISESTRDDLVARGRARRSGSG